MKSFGKFLIHVIFPIVVGTCIYIGWRSPSLFVFAWIDAIGANLLVVRPDFPIPEWALYSLPDGCWVYATTSWMLIIWHRIGPWAFTGVTLAVGGEIGQLVGVVPGTYEHLDMIFCIGGFLLAGACNAHAHMVSTGAIGNDNPRVWQYR